jgi:hypothetical protein
MIKEWGKRGYSKGDPVLVLMGKPRRWRKAKFWGNTMLPRTVIVQLKGGPTMICDRHEVKPA